MSSEQFGQPSLGANAFAAGSVSVSPRKTDFGQQDVEAYRRIVEPFVSEKLGLIAGGFLEDEASPDMARARRGARYEPEEVARVLGHLASISQHWPLEYARTMEAINAPDKAGKPDLDIAARFYQARLAMLEPLAQERHGVLYETRQEFLGALEWAVSCGLPVDLERARKLVGNIRLDIFDGSVEDSERGSYGAFKSATYNAYVAHDIDPTTHRAFFRVTVFHELLHGIAGMRVALNEYGQVLRKHKGLAGYQGRHRWVGEAFIERLANILACHEELSRAKGQIDFSQMGLDEFFGLPGVRAVEHSAYADEQYAIWGYLDRISPQESPLYLALSAQFEDYEPEGHPGIGLPGRQPLRKRFLQLLSDTVDLPALEGPYKKVGSRVLVEHMDETDPDKIQQIETDMAYYCQQRERRHLLRTGDKAATREAIARWRQQKAL